MRQGFRQERWEESVARLIVAVSRRWRTRFVESKNLPSPGARSANLGEHRAGFVASALLHDEASRRSLVISRVPADQSEREVPGVADVDDHQ